MNVTNVGIIGVGVMGEYHAKVYNNIRKMGIVGTIGITDLDGERAKEVANKYDCKSYSSVNELLENVDVVSICVPTSKHKDVVLDCISRCRDRYIRGILIEKPIASNIGDAMEIVGLVRKMGVKLLIGHTERFNPVVIGMKKIIDSGKLGHIVSISAKRVGPLPPRVKDVGVIIDMAVHDIDVISYLFGSYPTDVYAIDGNIKGMTGVVLGRVGLEDRASIMMRFNDGRVGIIETNWLTPHKVRKLDIVGFERVAYLDYTEQTISIHGHDMIEEIKLTREEPLMRELMHFIDIVRDESSNLKPLVTGEDGVQALRIALAATESYKTGNVVKLGMMIG